MYDNIEREAAERSDEEYAAFMSWLSEDDEQKEEWRRRDEQNWIEYCKLKQQEVNENKNEEIVVVNRKIQLSTEAVNLIIMPF